jgi:hypothetical protein
LDGALIENCVICLVGFGRAAGSADGDIDWRKDGHVHVNHAPDE